MIEIKFIRGVRGVTGHNEKSIRSDIDKLRCLIENNQHNVYGFMLVFTKTRKGYEKIQAIEEDIQDEPNLRFFHASGNVPD